MSRYDFVVIKWLICIGFSCAIDNKYMAMLFSVYSIFYAIEIALIVFCEYKN